MAKSRVKVIIGESHGEPSANLLLTALLPHLSGYQFFDEQPETVTLEENIEEQHTLIESGKHIADRLGYKVMHFETIQGLSKHRETFAQLLIACQKHHITYRGIDNSQARERNDNVSIRDEIMSRAILEEKGALFCRVGLKHFPGIQKHLTDSLKDHSEENLPLFAVLKKLLTLNNQYLFIFPTHSLPSTLCDSPIFPYVYINLSEESLENAVHRVCAQIDKQNAALNPETMQEEKIVTPTPSIQPHSFIINMKPEEQKINDETADTSALCTTKNTVIPSKKTEQPTYQKFSK